MKLGFSPVTAAILDLDEAFRLADELELDFIELSHDLHEVMPALQEPGKVQQLSRATGIGTTVHLSFVDLNLASVVPAARENAVERTRRGLEFGAAVGASCGVLHSGKNLIPIPQAAMLAMQALEQSLTELADPAVPIALENLVLSGSDLIRDARQLKVITSRHGFGNCLDFGHAHVEATAKGEPTIDTYLELMGDNLIHLHLHNNNGDNDDHLPTGQGQLDYAELLPKLAGFSGTACLEIRGSAQEVRASVQHLRELGVR